jgi:hypothetical protein
VPFAISIVDFRFAISSKSPNRRREILRLRVARVVKLDPFWEQTFAPALAATRERSATAFALHARTETMLAFARALGRLIGAFHKTEKLIRRDSRAVTVGMSRALSISPRRPITRCSGSAHERIDLAFAGCQRQ